MADLASCLAVAADPDAAPLIAPCSPQHPAAPTDPDRRHLLLVRGAGPVGFVLLAGRSGSCCSRD
ncbi:MAG: hypothetical protein JWM15_822, partial [Cryptosporangiaceae bacterium]|nr:hypothetical protein [Cryptosporangiaceae bacterium]